MDVIKKIRNYTLNERHCLGEGSFGKVFEAISDDKRKVAIKKVDQKLIISDRYLK
jgi:serine/threonine-protein kinase ULK2